MYRTENINSNSGKGRQNFSSFIKTLNILLCNHFILMC